MGDRQVAVLVRDDDHDPGLPPGPCVLLHGPADGRPRAARLVADQLLPARERDAALPGAAGRHAAVAHGARRRSTSRRPATDGSGGDPRHDVRLRGRHPTAPSAVADMYFSQGRRHRQHRQVAARARRCPRRARTPPSVAIGNTLFLIGGYGPDGKATSTVYSLTVGQDGTIGEWIAVDALKLPAPRAGSSAVAVSDGIVLLGGVDETGATNPERVEDEDQGRRSPGAWTEQSPLFEENVDGFAAHVGDVIFARRRQERLGRPSRRSSRASWGARRPRPTDPNAIIALWRALASDEPAGGRGRTWPASRPTARIYVQGGSDGSAPPRETSGRTPDATGVIHGLEAPGPDRPRAGPRGLGRRRVGGERVPVRRGATPRGRHRRTPARTSRRSRRSSSSACWAPRSRPSSSTARWGSRSAT